ncbi:MAG TPA: hypothetical protein VGF53_10075 [Pseudolabrys sp.]|jgi:hypothetical protein
MTDQILEFLDWGPKVIIIVIFVALAANAFLNRHMPRVGGRIGRRSAALPPAPPPEGFSGVECREITLYSPPADAARYESLKAYARDGAIRRAGLVHIYRVAGCKTRIEILAAPARYERIDAAEALALLRELPDPRFVHRLHLGDEPSYLDPWLRKVSGRDIFHLGNATNTGVIVLYRPDRRLGRELGVTLLHEWLHLLAFGSARAIRRFKRADRIEPLPALPIEPVSFGDPRTPIYEAWCDLGEVVLGYDETAARKAALASPLHTMILWRRVERIMRKVPKRLASTRAAEFEARGAFMRTEVAPRARAARRQHRWWRRWRAKAAG